jgi:type IV secretion system protein VirB10
MFAKEIAGEQTGGMIEPARPLIVPEMPTGPEAAPVMIAKPENLDAPPAPPGGGHLNAPVQDDEAMRIRMAKLQQLEEAVKAKTGVQVGAPRSSGSTPGGRTPATGAPQSRAEVLARISEVQQQINAQRESNPTAAYQERRAGRQLGRSATVADLGQCRRRQHVRAIRRHRQRPLEAGFPARSAAHAV